MAKIELKYVSKLYDNENYGLNDFSVSIESGTFVTVLGNSGSGKSTLLKLIAGLLKPDAGEIYIDDQLVNNVPPQKRDIAMMFQEYVLYPHYNVYDNIAAYLRFIKTDEETPKRYSVTHFDFDKTYDYLVKVKDKMREQSTIQNQDRVLSIAKLQIKQGKSATPYAI